MDSARRGTVKVHTCSWRPRAGGGDICRLQGCLPGGKPGAYAPRTTTQKNVESNGREAATFARDDWGKGWERLSAMQRLEAASGALILTIESMSVDVLAEQFGSDTLAGFLVVKAMITAMQKELLK